ncbi:hypothetical protein L9G74_18960 [Shewanella sp. C32]|uniref:Uncharacterized protein n=1 Tax=Shewanella electrica TaxID=515560 RepID=A0ABT2FQ91_9GAMM|nr:hypothetical protein [Shewanella electrica]MCH1926890.1 hypothetical protein [Shewanella electrica]MCS4558520.1 hypothetical protein [Shewanella electrica]
MQLKQLPDDAPTGYEFAMQPAANSSAVQASNDDHVDEVVIPAEIEVRELPPQAGTPQHPFKTYPIMYYSRGGISDFEEIQKRLHYIPQHLLHHACEQYERIYGKHGRKVANRWLTRVALKYKGVA